MRIGTRFALMGISAVSISALVVVGLGILQSRQSAAVSIKALEREVDENFKQIVSGVYSLAKVQSDAIDQQLDRCLDIARKSLAKAGGLSPSGANVSWEAVNQFDRKSHKVELPLMLLGGTPLPVERSSKAPVPLVDELTSLSGAKSTIFQRMNENGDMLRVATTVIGKDGRRAIGTYVPAVQPDGSPNPVVSSILRGEPYRGQAFVVDAWYQTVYVPLKDENGRVFGMLFHGIRQDSIPALRQAIMDIKLGKTGYVYVLSGSGESKGSYAISQGGKRDGERIWDTKSETGAYPIRDIVEKALAVPPGETVNYRYLWRNPGEAAPRWKRATLAYFKPWDWVIGAGAYEDEFQEGLAQLQQAEETMISRLLWAGLAVAIVCGCGFYLFGQSLSRKLNAITAAANSLAAGDVQKAEMIITGTGNGAGPVSVNSQSSSVG